MSSPVKEAIKVDLSDSSGESTDSEPHPLAVITSMGIIDLDPEFWSGPSTVVVNDILMRVKVSDRSCDQDQVSVWNFGIHQAEVADVNREGRLVGWRLDQFL
ncbi:hypothetical protein ACOSQ2_028774 [Xanthoceras sorbifolium]